MISEEDLRSAVNAGILTEETATALRAHVERLNQVPAVDEEHFRLVTGFNDIFVVIACLLLLVSANWIGQTFQPWFGPAALAWALGEFFIRKRHMALPAIVLLLAFEGGLVAAILFALNKNNTGLMAAAVLAAAGAWLHWARFQVPITVAAGTAAALACAVALLYTAVPESRNWMSAVSLIAGVAVFALAMYWDAGDTLRRTRRSDAAFWLHLLAAPLLVHPVFTALGVATGRASLGQALAVVALYVCIALISLSIDRRALMVSALAYVLYAFSSLLERYGVVSLSFAITALVIGSALLLLSAFWHTSRAFVLRQLPLPLKERLAPLR